MIKKQSHKKILLIDLNFYTNLNTTERNAYSFLVSLMLKFNNNQIYKASNKRLSKLTGTHRNSISKYINILKKFKFIEYNKDILILKSFSKKEKLYKLNLYRSLSAEKTKEIIETEILRLYINRQKLAIKVKQTLKGFQNNKSKKLLKKYSELLEGDYQKDVMFSIRYASQKLNVSINKIQTLLRNAENKGIIKVSKVYKYLKTVSCFNEFKQLKTTLNNFSDVYYNLTYDFKSNKVFHLIGSDISFKLELT